MENCFFSIIIPVYNIQEYLEECVSSVLSQTFQKFELILVDDGSTDESGRLCDQLAQTDGRIQVVHQANRGSSGARNRGLEQAAGQYVLFLDGDDFYPQDHFLEEIYLASENKDVVCFNYARYTNKLLKKLIVFPEPEERLDRLWSAMIQNNAYTSSACLKAVKRSLLLKNAIAFEEGVTCEDIEWCAKVMCSAKSLALVPDCVYAYRVRPGSTTQRISTGHIKSQLHILGKIAAAEVQGSEMFQNAYRGYVAFQYCTVLINLRLCRPKIDKHTRQQVKELSWLLDYDLNQSVHLIHRVYRMVGFEITSWLLVIYFKLFCW